MAVGRLWQETYQRQLSRKQTLILDESAAIADPKRAPNIIFIQSSGDITQMGDAFNIGACYKGKLAIQNNRELFMKKGRCEMFRLFAAVLTLSFGVTQASLAATYTYSFVADFDSIIGTDGVANSSTSDIAGGFSTLTGTITLDDTSASAVSGGSNGAKGYYAAPVLTINEFTSGLLEAPERTVVENDATSFDQLFFGYTNSVGVGDIYDRVDLILRDSSSTAFSSTDLPTSLILSDFNIATLFFFSRTSGGFERRNFDVVSLTPSVIPVPAAVWLFGTALVGLIGFSKRRKAA